MAPELIDKVPPHSLEGEMSVLGAMMLSQDALGLVVQHLDADSFYRKDHASIFRVIVEMYDANRPVDLVTLKEELRRAGVLEEIGGEQYLITLADSVPTISNAEYYARIVKEKALLRGLIQAGAEIIRDAHQQDTVDEVLDRCEKRIFDVTQRKVIGDLYDIRSILSNVLQKLDLQGRQAITGLATGFHDLDDKTRGLQAGEMIVLAARPSVGKSALALNLAEHVAVDGSQPVAFFTIEMSKEELALRLLGSRARVDGLRLRKGELNNEEVRRIQNAAEILYTTPLYIDDTPSLRIIDMRAKARRMVLHHQIKLIIVDYLQLMSSPGAESRQIEVSNISRGLKSIARELQIPVLAVAQLRRESEEHNRPRLSDLRESGAIEQDADVVLLLHREEMRHTPGTPEHAEHQGEAEIIIAKQRNGPTGTIKLTWMSHLTRFETWSPREAPEGPPVHPASGASGANLGQYGAEEAAVDDAGQGPPF